MGRMPNGFRKVRGDWANDSLYARPRRRTAPAPKLTEAELEEAQARRDAETANYLAQLNARNSQGRAIEKIVDSEARIAVEGDTAVDDAPFGESGE